MTLVRAVRGYGFKVTVGSPVYINEIIEGLFIVMMCRTVECSNLFYNSYFILLHLGLPAHESDIQVGDLILEVEGTDVIHADGDMVANMIRY